MECKFKIGDEVIVAHKDTIGMAQYPIGYVFKIVKVRDEGYVEPVYYPEEGNGCYEHELELATVNSWKERIKNAT